MVEVEGNAWERAIGYELLAGIFLKEPSMAQFELLKKWASSLENDSWLEELLREIEEKDPDLEELVQTYYDLFFVPVSGRFVPPFEAAIRGAQRKETKKTKFGEFWGSSTLQVLQIYKQIGFEPEKLDIFQPLKDMNIPDHIGFELSALAYLCQVEAKWLEEKKDITPLRNFQRVLLDEHLNQWLGQLKKDLDRVDTTGFYTFFAQLASEFCQEEAKTLTDTLALERALN